MSSRFARVGQLTEPGPLQPTPLTEESALRETNQPEGPDCDKIAVERAYLDDANPPHVEPHEFNYEQEDEALTV